MDILQRNGNYPLPPQASKTILGVEFAGTISKTGSSTSEFKEGDEVFGLSYGVSPCDRREMGIIHKQGAYAEYAILPELMTVKKPKEIDWAAAAGIPENWLTGEASQRLRRTRSRR